MENLFQRSIMIISDNQAASGAYIASPDFPNYYYWFVVGSFTAYDKDLVGEHASVARFHDWTAIAIIRRPSVAQRTVGRVKTKKPYMPLPDSRERTAGLFNNYLTALWQHPCYDCWEEYPDKNHHHTLAAIVAPAPVRGTF